MNKGTSLSLKQTRKRRACYLNNKCMENVYSLAAENQAHHSYVQWGLSVGALKTRAHEVWHGEPCQGHRLLLSTQCPECGLVVACVNGGLGCGLGAYWMDMRLRYWSCEYDVGGRTAEEGRFREEQQSLPRCLEKAAGNKEKWKQMMLLQRKETTYSGETNTALLGFHLLNMVFWILKFRWYRLHTRLCPHGGCLWVKCSRMHMGMFRDWQLAGEYVLMIKHRPAEACAWLETYL